MLDRASVVLQVKGDLAGYRQFGGMNRSNVAAAVSRRCGIRYVWSAPSTPNHHK